MKTIYLDYSSTTPLAPEVINELEAMLTHFGNASSTHPFGWYAEEKVNIARQQVANSIGATSESIVFTSGATESNNLAIKGVAAKNPGCHLLSVATEHRAVLDPLESLSKQNYSVDILSVNELGELDLEELEKKIQKSTKIVSIMLANNEIGTIHPIEKISKICKQKSVLLHCDATQALGRIKIDVNTLGVDLLSISAHKCYGPKGVGALFVRPRVVLAPQIEGGGHERDLRSGTLNTLGISGFGVAAELADTLQATDAEQLNRLSARLMKQLEDELGEIILNGSSTKRLPGSINISIPSISNERLLAKIQTKLAFSLASACQSAKKEPSHVLSALGIEKSRISSSIRLSIGRYSTENEIDRAANILTKAVKQLRQKT